MLVILDTQLGSATGSHSGPLRMFLFHSTPPASADARLDFVFKSHKQQSSTTCPKLAQSTFYEHEHLHTFSRTDSTVFGDDLHRTSQQIQCMNLFEGSQKSTHRAFAHKKTGVQAGVAGEGRREREEGYTVHMYTAGTHLGKGWLHGKEGRHKESF